MHACHGWMGLLGRCVDQVWVKSCYDVMIPTMYFMDPKFNTFGKWELSHLCTQFIH